MTTHGPAAGQPASSTIFVADLPAGVQESDLSLTFGNLVGYASSRLRVDRQNRVVGFVEFHSPADASAAMQQMDGRPVQGGQQPMKMQFAKAQRTGPTQGAPPAKRARDDDVGPGMRPPPSARGGSYMDTGYDAEPVPSRGSLGSTARGAFADHLPQPPQYPQETMSPGAAPGLGGGMMGGAPMPLHPARAHMVGGPADMLGANLPPDASPTLYVDNVPLDATVRELSHIFRPFPGYHSVRIIHKEPKRPGDPKRVLCFVEFSNKFHATAARNTTQGYRMDVGDARGLGVEFAKVRGSDGGAAAPGSGQRAQPPLPPLPPNDAHDSLRAVDRGNGGSRRDDRYRRHHSPDSRSWSGSESRDRGDRDRDRGRDRDRDRDRRRADRRRRDDRDDERGSFDEGRRSSGDRRRREWGNRTDYADEEEADRDRRQRASPGEVEPELRRRDSHDGDVPMDGEGLGPGDLPTADEGEVLPGALPFRLDEDQETTPALGGGSGDAAASEWD